MSTSPTNRFPRAAGTRPVSTLRRVDFPLRGGDTRCSIPSELGRIDRRMNHQIIHYVSLACGGPDEASGGT